MKRLLAATVIAVGLWGSPAYADHEGGGYYAEEDCRNGGCGHREEDYEGANCKYVCPEFRDSPVHDAFNFNPQICLPGATCHFEDRNPEQGEQPQ